MDKVEAIAHLDEHGYARLEQALTLDQAKALPGRSAELIAAEKANSEYIYLDSKSQRVWNLVNKGRTYEEMIQHPRVPEL